MEETIAVSDSFEVQVKKAKENRLKNFIKRLLKLKVVLISLNSEKSYAILINKGQIKVVEVRDAQ